MDDDRFRSAPDFTNACVVMFGVNLAWVLLAIWSFWGLVVALLFSYSLDRGITWLHHRRAVRQAAAIKRGKPF